MVPFQPAVAFPGESAVVKVTTDFIPTLTARVGYAVDHVLLYAKGGAAWAYNKYSVIGTFQGTPFDAEGLSIKTGWTAGVGVEWAFAGNWTMKFEYDYLGLGNQTFTVPATAPFRAGDTFTTSGRSVQMAKFGINYLFGGGARY